MPLNPVTSETTYTCPACALKFTDESLVKSHENTPTGNYPPPEGLVYAETREGGYFFVVRRWGGSLAQEGDHLHEQIFTFYPYFEQDPERIVHNDMIGTGRATSGQLLKGLRSGRLKLLDEAEFTYFKRCLRDAPKKMESAKVVPLPLVRTSQELTDLLQ